MRILHDEYTVDQYIKMNKKGKKMPLDSQCSTVKPVAVVRGMNGKTLFHPFSKTLANT
jgi:hypothetical protein